MTEDFGKIGFGGMGMNRMKQDSSTIGRNRLGDEWFELARTGESRNYFIMPYMLKLLRDVSQWGTIMGKQQSGIKKESGNSICRSLFYTKCNILFEFNRIWLCLLGSLSLTNGLTGRDSWR